MQIIILMGPYSRAREIHLSTKNIVFGGIFILLTIFGVSWVINSFTYETRDVLLSLNLKQFTEKHLVTSAKNDYEVKLIELQARLDEAQRKLDQLDALRSQLLRSNGRLNLSHSQLSDAELAKAQGGPLRSSSATYYPDNKDEQYGVRLDRTLQDAFAMQARLSEVQNSLTHSWDVANSAPTGLPLFGSTQPTSGLGYRLDPFTRQIAWHDGTDYPAAYGTAILATAEGRVIRAGWDSEYGNLIELAHKNGVITRYAHAQELLVKSGDDVKKSQVIAKVGSTGRSTGPHVHYEILRNGVALGQSR
jgi:murein DD-endopeptidase MepM/ murein hydrolase activator NlpD